MIGGWFESEYGPVDIAIERTFTGPNELAAFLYMKYGDISGVDMELDGEYENGKEVDAISVCEAIHWFAD